MAGLFRFTFDGYIEIEDQPRGWDSAKIVIERSDEYSGLFINYLTELEFWGDGYEYLKTQIDNIGYCTSVYILIEYQCQTGGIFETVFSGYINILNADVDMEKCTVKANIEPDDLYSKFLKDSENEINVYNQYTAVGSPNLLLTNGQSIPGVAEIVQVHNNQTGAYGTITPPNLYMFKALNLLDFMVKFYTGNSMSVVSDYFSILDVYLNQKYELVFDNPILSGQTVEVEFKNYFNNTVTISQTFDTSNGVTLRYLSYKLLTKYDQNLPGNLSDVGYQIFDDSIFSYSETDEIDTINLESFLPFEIIRAEVTGPGLLPNITVTVTQEYNQGNGHDNYIYFNQDAIFDESNDNESNTTYRYLSFKRLFNSLSAFHNLAFQIQKLPAGNYQMRIEPLEYFYNQTVSYQINGPINIVRKYDESNNFVNVQAGSSATYDPATNSSKFLPNVCNTKQYYNASNCIGNTLNISHEVNSDILKQGDNFPVNPTPDDSAISIVKVSALQTVQYNLKIAFLDTVNNVYFPERLYAFNANLTNTHNVINHFNKINGDITFTSNNKKDFPAAIPLIINTATVNQFSYISFDFFISFSDMLSFITNPQYAVEVDLRNTGEYQKFYIKKIEFDVNTKKANFELYEA